MRRGGPGPTMDGVPRRFTSRIAASRVPSLTSVALLALYLFDAVVLGHGFIAAGLLVAVAIGLLPKYMLLQKIGATSWPTARLAVLCTLCAAAIMLTISFNNSLAQRRGDELVSAISHYRAVAGHYPRALDELVPAYIDAVPRAKLTLSFSHFNYANEDGRVLLGYQDTPPFGHTIYDFAARRWEHGP